MKSKKITAWLAALVLILGLFVLVPKLIAQSTPKPVTGWAWSSNIGWVEMDTKLGLAGDKPVTIDTDGVFSGYGWSSNIGWLQFNPAGPYPTAPNHGVQIDLTTNTMSGWGRFLSNGGGWDGWVNFSNVKYLPENKQFSGYAWGADVVGWLDMSQAFADLTTIVTPTCDPKYNNDCTCANPDWKDDNPSSCPDGGGSLSVQCSASPSQPRVDAVSRLVSVVWTATASGGDGSYQYAWGDSQSYGSNQDTESYGVGDQNIAVSAKDGSGKTGVTTCAVTVADSVINAPGIDFTLNPSATIANCDALICSDIFYSRAITVTNGPSSPSITVNASLVNSASLPGVVPEFTTTDGATHNSVILDSGQSAVFRWRFNSRTKTNPAIDLYNFTVTGSNTDGSITKPATLRYIDRTQTPI